MKDLEKIKFLLNQLKAEIDNEFEMHRIEVLEQDLIEGLPTVEIINDIYQKFNGRMYHRTKSGHYQNGRMLHQDVWAYYRGEIPQGNYEIHHIDWDASNNSIENLQLVTPKEHRRIHSNTPPPEVSHDKLKLFTCERCGKSFVTAITRQVHRFCSRSCQRATQLDTQKNSEKTCLHCGKTFKGHENAKFCSRECKTNYSKAQVPIQTCPQCGKQFRGANGKRRKIYCSRECFLTARRLNANGIVGNLPNVRNVTCKNCGKEFVTLHPLKCYCSEECKIEAAKKKSHIYKKICPICGKEFLGVKRQKYCSTECRDQARRNSLVLTEKICPCCGKSFKTRDKRVKYCSKGCYHISKNKAHQKSSAKKVEQICLQCGKSFKSNNKNPKYCSKECYDKAKRTLSDKICPTCGKKFHPKRENIKFCSQKCIRHEKRAKVEITKTCPVCGKEFKTDNKRKIHCSRECAHIKLRNTTRHCPVCGKEFHDKPEGQIHCSRHCANIARRTPNKKCVVCGKEFHPVHSVKSKYCSKECACTPLKNERNDLKIGYQFSLFDN